MLMNISASQGFTPVDSVGHKQNNKMSVLKMSTPLSKDSVNFSGKTIFTRNDNLVPPTAWTTFERYGVQTRPIYFNEVFDKNFKTVIDKIKERRNEILVDTELMRYYGVSREDVHSAYKNGELKPYGIPEDTTVRPSTNDRFMFDIRDKANSSAIERFEQHARTAKLYKKRDYLERICNANTVPVEEFPASAYPASALQRQGYGSKADLMANIGLHLKAYDIKNYILENDNYDISTPIMNSVIKNARKNNPALVGIDELKKSMGEENFFNGVITKQISFKTPITEFDPPLGHFVVDLDDKKNLEYLKSVDDDKFQTWLSARLDKAQKYKASNLQKLEEYRQETKPKTKDEVRKTLQQKFEEIRQRRLEKRQQEALLKAQEKANNARNQSLRSTIAWTLAENTLQTQKENSNPHIREAGVKLEKLDKIQDELMNGSITYEEAELEIQKLNVPDNAKHVLLSFYKKCWEISGTEEWKQALKEAQKLTEIYNQQGLDGIEDEKVRNRLIQWEQEKGDKYSV